MDKKRELQKLSEEIASCRKCDLYQTRRKAVPGEGKEDAEIFFVGESPGEEEDRLGRPFVGRAGRFLDELLKASGLRREDVFITSVLKSHPSGNRPPKRSEVEACLPYLKRQLEIVNPKLVVLLGNVALRSLLGAEKVSQTHGFVEKNGRMFFATYHPSAGMRFPKIRRRMLEDFKKLKTFIRG
ncbi:uracil-DNA glycosylase [Candidatus Hecatella orcuttiae]|jgi:DNA polymerase|uniref:uracil-DNA glycosylase n=1 Tax=Candidatus Hecatella orcuttiae TaxID=1935119 RepID=UPI002867C92D|nr:uracil-DNA glycosylase [Candidatus Hecatella orcuttiae]